MNTKTYINKGKTTGIHAKSIPKNNGKTDNQVIAYGKSQKPKKRKKNHTITNLSRIKESNEIKNQQN